MNSTARYLLRFDDLTPTMSRAGWERFLALIRRYKLTPILAIVPDNQDPDLMVDEPDANFWQEMRELASAGACIGLHGLTHMSHQRGRSFIPLHRQTEFAGASESLQQQMIEQGIQLLRAEGLTPKIFVAPRHGFDSNTLRALRSAGLTILSDGLTARPFRKGGVVWIPQQLWEPAHRSSGLWTICIHANTCTPQQFAALEEFVAANLSQFTGVEAALDAFPPGSLHAGAAAMAWARLTKIRLSKWSRKFRG